MPRNTPRNARNEHEAKYRAEGLPKGQTIPEFEAANGLPLFSVWPEAELARGASDPGWFLYCNANEVERAQMERKAARLLGRRKKPRKKGL